MNFWVQYEDLWGLPSVWEITLLSEQLIGMEARGAASAASPFKTSQAELQVLYS